MAIFGGNPSEVKPLIDGEMSSYQYQFIRFRYAIDILWYHSTGIGLIFWIFKPVDFCRTIAEVLSFANVVIPKYQTGITGPKILSAVLMSNQRFCAPCLMSISDRC